MERSQLKYGTEFTSVKVSQQPGGTSSINLGWDEPPRARFQQPEPKPVYRDDGYRRPENMHEPVKSRSPQGYYAQNYEEGFTANSRSKPAQVAYDEYSNPNYRGIEFEQQKAMPRGENLYQAEEAQNRFPGLGRGGVYGQNLGAFGRGNEGMGGPPMGGDGIGRNNDPYGRNANLYARNNEPYARSNDPYARNNEILARNNDPYARNNDTYGRNNEPYGRNNDPYARNNEPYGRNADPYARNNEAYARNNDPYSRNNYADPQGYSENQYARQGNKAIGKTSVKVQNPPGGQSHFTFG
jgi:hypothetical protein